MTIPQNVKDAVESLECEIADPEDCTAWQTIRANLLSQEAEIERLSQESAQQFIRARDWAELSGKNEDRASLAESRLAAANERLEAAERDSKRLDFMEREHCTVRAEATCDDDVFYEVVDYYMAEPQERVIGSGATPRDALDAAIAAAQEGEE